MFFVFVFSYFVCVFIKAYLVMDRFIQKVMSNKQICKLISLNVRRIRNSIKRSSIFTYLKDQNATFYVLQETYSEPCDESFWENEWGGEIFFSHGTRHSKGTCILLNPSIKEYKIKNSLSDNSGRIVLINLIYNRMELSLCNIYAPNDHADQLRFIEELNNYLIDQSHGINDTHYRR